MQRGNPVHAIGHDKAQGPNTNLTVVAHRNAARWIGLLVTAVDPINDLKVTGQKIPHQPIRPAFKRFGQQSVVCVVQTGLRNVARAVKVQPALIVQKPDKLGSGNRRVRVI